MKIHFFIVASLCLFCSVALSASNVEGNLSAPAVTPITKEVKHLNLVEMIPGRTLNVEVTKGQDLLKVDLSGNNSDLEWILFQPKGGVISRIKTASKINQVMIGNLDKGTYVLMLKDGEGRILTDTFVKA